MASEFPTNSICKIITSEAALVGGLFRFSDRSRDAGWRGLEMYRRIQSKRFRNPAPHDIAI
jgi:hypothetical protein